MDLQSHGVPEEIQLGCSLDDLEQLREMCKLVPPLLKYRSIFFNILATMHYIISKMVSTHMFSWSKNVVL